MIQDGSYAIYTTEILQNDINTINSLKLETDFETCDLTTYWHIAPAGL